MRQRISGLGLLISLWFVLALGRAAADPPTVDLGLTLNPVLGGVHESFNDRVDVPPIPIPLIEGRYRNGPIEVLIQDLPPLGYVHYHDEVQGHTGTELTVFEGIVRVWDPLHRYALGIGQTLYTQSTHYADSVEITGVGETQTSRVTGLAYALAYGIPFHRGRFEAGITYSPVMLGTKYTFYDIPAIPRRADPERAEQIDTALRFTHPAGAGELILGLRYINYTARYAELHGGLSDRNVGVLPVIGYRFHLGRKLTP